MADSTAKMVRFSATGFEKSESKSRKALSSSSASDASMTQCSGGSSALARAPRRELACARSSTDAIILAIGLPSSLSVSSALKRPMMAPFTRKGESMPRAWISSSMYRLHALLTVLFVAEGKPSHQEDATRRAALDVLDHAPPQVRLGDLDEELLQQELEGEDFLAHLRDDLPLAVEGECEGVTQQDRGHE